MTTQKPPVTDDQIEGLARMGLTELEVAQIICACRNRLSEKQRKRVSVGHALMKMNLRRLQLEAAQAGSVPMLIWLGRQYLGQSDRPQQPQAGRQPARLSDADGTDGRSFTFALTPSPTATTSEPIQLASSS